MSTVDRTIVDHTVDRTTTRPLAGTNRLKLGVFGPNLSAGAGSISCADGPPVMGNWDEAKSIVVAADRAGFEVVVPIARWMGHGGASRFWDRSFETMTWGAGLAAVTEDIFIMTTCHVPMVHPVLAAKMGATVDHIAGGRWGLNLVAGWSKPEFELFGIEFAGHADRYRLAEEWIQTVMRLWGEDEPFDFDGEFFHIKHAISRPKPVQAPYPVIMNAGMSPPGLALASTYSDMVYIGLAGATDVAASVARVREAASARGREVGVWALANIVAGDTEKEARELVRWYADEHGDVETAIDYATLLKGTDTASQEAFRKDSDLVRNLMISQGNYSIIGSSEQIAERLGEFSAVGVDGLALAFFDYHEGVAQFRDNVMPLLANAGLRVALVPS